MAVHVTVRWLPLLHAHLGIVLKLLIVKVLAVVLSEGDVGQLKRLGHTRRAEQIANLEGWGTCGPGTCGP